MVELDREETEMKNLLNSQINEKPQKTKRPHEESEETLMKKIKQGFTKDLDVAVSDYVEKNKQGQKQVNPMSTWIFIGFGVLFLIVVIIYAIFAIF